MKEMKAILVGLGEAGFGWYRIVQRFGKLSLAVVDTNIAMKDKLAAYSVEAAPPFYTSLEKAIQKEKPQFIINVTPPHIHAAVNKAAFQHCLPVLSEKPISYNYYESVQITAIAEQCSVPFMIAENYRNQARMRKLKNWLDNGAIGKLKAVHIEFGRNGLEGRTYDVRLLHDIVVHHMDLLRFLTGQEGLKVFAEKPLDNEHIHILVELSGDISAVYTARVHAKAKETPWHGYWTLEGDDGTVSLGADGLILKASGKETVKVNDFTDIQHPNCLEQFVNYLQGGPVPETMAYEYLKTEALVYGAERSAEQGKWVAI